MCLHTNTHIHVQYIFNYNSQLKLFAEAIDCKPQMLFIDIKANNPEYSYCIKPPVFTCFSCRYVSYQYPILFFIHLEPKPKLGPIVVSETRPNSLTLSWSTLSGHLDGFAARVTDREQLYDVVELRLSGAERNVTVTGLMDSTVYDIVFYGLSRGRQTPAVSFNTSTGTVQVFHASITTNQNFDRTNNFASG